MNRIGLIFRKELLSAARDRRVLISTVVVPLLVLPLVTMLPMMLYARREAQVREAPSSISLSGTEYPELERELRSSGRFAFLTSDSVEQAVRRGKLDVGVDVLNRPEGRSSARVRVVFNATRAESRAAADKVKLVIAELSKQLVRGSVDTTRVNLDPLLAVPVNVASEREMSGFFLGLMVGMMAVLGLISGGMVMAIDSTAGEKERRTLEVLLAAPVARYQVVLGKFLATVATGMVSVVLMTTGYTLSFTLGLRSLGQGATELGSPQLSISVGVVAVVLLVMVAVAGFVGALEMAVSIFARSYREAQSYLTPLTIIAVVPVVFIQTIPPNPPGPLFYIPLLNAMLLVRELLMGSVVSGHIANTLVSSLVCALLALRFAFSMFRRESVLLR